MSSRSNVTEVTEPAPTVSRVPFSLPVHPDGPDGRAWDIPGELYLPAGQVPRTVQVLVPGLTYDRRYWTLPEPYNYAEFMAAAGYAVAVFDRLGTGGASRPPAEEVTIDAHVLVLRRLVQGLRSGSLVARKFERVVVVGHSYGSGIAIMEAARHKDVDGLIITGMLHAFTELYGEVRGFFHPGTEDPVVGPTNPPPGYLTQQPGRRATMLEYEANIDPAMSKLNEAIKSTGTLGEGETLEQTYDAASSLGVGVPVLVVVGEHDALFGGKDVDFNRSSEAVHSFEQAYYSPASRLETYVIPRAGHSLNLHYNARTWFAIARDWIDRLVPPARGA
ncbi:MAG TPA: alpha/beta fold hydrolase [Streptosporangiaceae bacterium]|nr:alpha/beta fold hydrolase [Streptosporangiaceae bacterium]